MKYLLSKFIPTRFTTTYTTRYRAGDVSSTEVVRSTWWQWGDKIFAHKESTCLTV